MKTTANPPSTRKELKRQRVIRAGGKAHDSFAVDAQGNDGDAEEEMAQLAHHHFGWVGHGFAPGVEHHWWFGPVLFTDVVNVMAHPIVRLPRETLVKDIRVHADGSGNATLLFTVRNTGANTIPGYGVDFSVVRP